MTPADLLTNELIDSLVGVSAEEIDGLFDATVPPSTADSLACRDRIRAGIRAKLQPLLDAAYQQGREDTLKALQCSAAVNKPAPPPPSVTP